MSPADDFEPDDHTGNALGHDKQEAPTWRECAPPLRENHSLVYDERRDCFYVVGGSQYVYPTTIWRLRIRPDTRWTPLEPENAGPRQPLAGVYDPIHDRLLVYAWNGPDRADFGIWQLSLGREVKWSVLLPAGPGLPQSDGRGIAFDAQRQRLYLVGRAGLSRVDLAADPTWGRLAVEWPDRYFDAQSTIYDPSRDKLYILERGNSLSIALDTDGLETESLAFDAVGAVLDPVGDQLVGCARFSEIVAFDLRTGSERLVYETPWPGDSRGRFAIAFDPVDRQLVRHGGAVFQITHSSLEIAPVDRGGPWVITHPFSGGARTWESVLVDGPRNRVVSFGGYTDPVNLRTMYLGDRVGDADSIAVAPGPRPANRVRAAFAHDTKRDRYLLFGGESSDGDRVWALENTSPPAWKLLEVAGDPPPPGDVATACYDAKNDRMLVVMNGVWALDLESAPRWSRVTLEDGSPLQYGGTFDETGSRFWAFKRDSLVTVTLHGGFASVRTTPTTGTAPVWPNSRAYDPDARQIIAFDLYTYDGWPGFHNYDYSAFHTLDVGPHPRWVRHETLGDVPSLRYGVALVYDRKDDRLVLFGGFNDDDHYYDDTYTLSLKHLRGRGHDRGEVEPLVETRSRTSPRLSVAAATATVGAALTLRVELPAPGPAHVDLFDLAGRRVRHLDLVSASGLQRVRLAEPNELLKGIYFARVRQGGEAAVTRLAIVR